MYRLFYGDLELGTVTRTGGDFPWNWGKFEAVDETDASGLSRLIERYRQMTAQKYPLIESEDFEGLQVIEEKIQHEFPDLLTSDQWRMVDGEDSWGIMPPEFPAVGRIAWR